MPDSTNWLKYLLAPPRPPSPRHPPFLPASPARTPVFHFGLVADVQYARLRTARGVKGALRRRRAWREAPSKLGAALRAFDSARADFAVNLGDAIEGYALRDVRRSVADLRAVAALFDRAPTPVFHVVGNHCRRVPLPDVRSVLRLCDLYYAFRPAEGWRCVVLFTAEMCGGAVDETKEEGELLRGVVEREGRAMHHFHGAVSGEQLAWLEMQLDQAEDEGELVVVFSHHPLADGSARASHVLANTRQVREIVEREDTPVVLCLAGHDHMGGMLTVPATEQRRAVTYVTVPAILEAPKRGNAYGLVKAYSDGCLTIDGVGDVISCAVPFSTCKPASDTEV